MQITFKILILLFVIIFANIGSCEGAKPIAKETPLLESLPNPVDVTPPWLNIAPSDVYIDGSCAYVVGPYTGLHVFDIHDANNPTWLGSIDTYNGVEDVAVSEGYAYIICGDALETINAKQPDALNIVSRVDLEKGMYTLDVSGGYVHVANYDGELLIFDITTPSSPLVVNTVDMPGYANDVVVEDGYAYVVDSDYGIHIVDVDPPEKAHNIYNFKADKFIQHIAVSQGFVYATSYEKLCCDETANVSFDVIDVNHVGNPHLVRMIKADGFSEGAVATAGNYAYWVDGEKLHIIDITKPRSADIVNSIDYRFIEGNLAVSGGYIFAADEYRGLGIIDVEPANKASVVYTLANASDVSDVEISNGYAYLTDYYSGIHIIDVSPPESAHMVRTFDIPGNPRDTAISGGHAFTVVDGSFHILDINPPEDAYIVNALTGFDRRMCFKVAVSDGYALAGCFERLWVIDVDPVDDAHTIAYMDYDRRIQDIEATGNGIYAFDGENILTIDISRPSSPDITYFYPIGHPKDSTVSDGYAYTLSWNEAKLAVFDIGTEGDFSSVNIIDLEKYPECVFVSAGYAYVTTDSYLQIIDIDPIETARVITTFKTGMFIAKVFVVDNYAYLADAASPSQGMKIIKLW